MLRMQSLLATRSVRDELQTVGARLPDDPSRRTRSCDQTQPRPDTLADVSGMSVLSLLLDKRVQLTRVLTMSRFSFYAKQLASATPERGWSIPAVMPVPSDL